MRAKIIGVRVRPRRVIAVHPIVALHLRLDERANHCEFRNSVRARLLNDSMYAFWVGFPGWMKSSSTSCSSDPARLPRERYNWGGTRLVVIRQRVRRPLSQEVLRWVLSRNRLKVDRLLMEVEAAGNASRPCIRVAQ